MSDQGTKQKILNAAEHLFARDGYHTTSLRSITSAAAVNLASVNYHFGSKELLLEAVIMRRLGPLNKMRESRLDDLLANTRDGEQPACREIIRSFVEPTLRLRQSGAETEAFVALVGRILAEPRGIAMSIFSRQMAPLMIKIFNTLSQSMPGLSRQKLFWRLHFTIGSLSHIMRCHERHSMVPDDISIEIAVEEMIDLFLDFAVAGMEA